MKTDKVQKLIFNAMLAGGYDVRKYIIDEKTTAYSVGKARCFCLKNDEIMFDANKIKTFSSFPEFYSRIDNDKVLKLTRDATIFMNSNLREKTARKFENEDGAIYINTELLDCFNNYILCGQAGTEKRVLVYEQANLNAPEILRGIVMPIRYDGQ